MIKKLIKKIFRKNDSHIVGKCVNKIETADGVIYQVDLSKDGKKLIKKMLKNMEGGIGFYD